jgi:NAD(P)-dependent dehydrogenase (short-subunit alcohol dehydrogenase family)
MSVESNSLAASAPGRLRGRVAVVTAGSGGIGGAIALRLARDGAQTVICLDRNPAVHAMPDQLLALGADSAAYQLSCQDEQAVPRTFQEIQERFGPVDILVNGVGGGVRPPAEFWCADPATLPLAIETSLFSAMLCSRQVVPGMRERRFGKIVNIGSGVALAPVPQLVPYGAAKNALIAFTRGLALELAPFQVNVNIVSPGPIATRGVQSLPAETREFSRRQIPMGFIGEPNDVANAVAFFASEESRFVTGQNLLVNGGRAFN